MDLSEKCAYLAGKLTEWRKMYEAKEAALAQSRQAIQAKCRQCYAVERVCRGEEDSDNICPLVECCVQLEDGPDTP